LALYQGDELKKLLKFYPRSVGLSVYSALSEVHESITRVKNSLIKTLTIANQLSEAGVALYFKCPIMTINAQSYHTVATLAAKYNAVPQFDVNLTAAMDGDVSITNHLRLKENALNIILRDPLQPLYVGMNTPNGGKKLLSLKESLCGAGTDMASITPFGEVYPCNSFPMPCGNVKKETFVEIWKNSTQLKSFRKITYEDCEQCGRNERCYFCNRCVGQSYIESKTPLKSSTDNCFISNVRMNIGKDLNYMKGICQIDVRKELQKIELITSIDFNKEF
jgi:MoaA/NifB/PqqE/SkfB family radical SAM enzyme